MEETEEDIVMVKIKRKTRDRLKALGKKGDTYEDIISKAIGNIGAMNNSDSNDSIHESEKECEKSR